jgi:hypothetical protein
MNKKGVFTTAVLALCFGAGFQGDSIFDLKSIPAEFAAEVRGNAGAMKVIGADNWSRIMDVSKMVREEGLTGVAQSKYLSFAAQRKLFRDIEKSASIPPDTKLLLQDFLIQYYFFTYYYHHQNPRRRSFVGEHKAFLDGLKVEYVWIEPAGQNYYQHTFLKKLVQKYPEAKWGKYYKEIYYVTGFEEIPRESEGEEAETQGGEKPELKKPEAPGAKPASRAQTRFQAAVSAGDVFAVPFGPGFTFRLEPSPAGWMIIVRYKEGEEDISRLTPPFHFIPNPREIEGWHFRNSDNTGPNEAGEKNVNAPGKVREFIFSPEVGRTIQGPESRRAINEAEIDDVRAFGRGVLKILDFKLGNLGPGRQARFERMKFEVVLSWPEDFKE